MESSVVMPVTRMRLPSSSPMGTPIARREGTLRGLPIASADVQIGILGGTGPAGLGLAARLASVGMEPVIGSRSAERAAQVRAELVGSWPGRGLSIGAADNAGAAACDLVVVATPWDG